MNASYCGCLICRLEARLMDEIGDDQSNEEFRLFAISSPILSAYPTAFEVIEQLHSPADDAPNHFSDELLLDLLRRRTDTVFRPAWQRLMLLVFIPTVHRTTTRITTAFPSLTRDDVAQHLVTVLLDFLHSKELRSRHSHLAFTIARKIRRSAFRWAIREARQSLWDQTDAMPIGYVDTGAGDDDSFAHVLLQQFLDNCQRRGWLSTEERELLTQFKVEGISAMELSRRSGHSVTAIRHRVQRIVDRLRRVAQASGNGTGEQLNLFAR